MLNVIKAYINNSKDILVLQSEDYFVIGQTNETIYELIKNVELSSVYIPNLDHFYLFPIKFPGLYSYWEDSFCYLSYLDIFEKSYDIPIGYFKDAIEDVIDLKNKIDNRITEGINTNFVGFLRKYNHFLLFWDKFNIWCKQHYPEVILTLEYILSNAEIFSLMTEIYLHTGSEEAYPIILMLYLMEKNDNDLTLTSIPTEIWKPVINSFIVEAKKLDSCLVK